MRSNVLHRSGLAACFVLLCAGTSSRAATEDDPLAAPRTQFQQAYGSLALSPVQSEPVQSATPDSPSLRGYVLYPYLQSARLAQALRNAGTDVPVTLDEEIAAFLRANDSQPVSRDLRSSWLASLAERAQWERFLAFHRRASDEPALRCYGFTARIELQHTVGLAMEIAQAWLTPRSVPECERAFEWLRASGGLDAALVEQRAHLALEDGNAAFAREIAQPLPPERAAPLLQWAALLENPQREIDALIAAPQTTVATPALLAGWARLARSDRGAAKQRFAGLVTARALDQRAASPFALALALPLAWDRDPETLAYFARVDDADVDDAAREWYARAALWAGDWKQVTRCIAALKEDTRRSARWRYWAARAATHEGDATRARQLYESILPEDNYYSAMAAAHLKRKVRPNAQRLPVDEAQLGRVGILPAFVRARELRLSGLTRDAAAEWRFGQDALQPGALPQAVHLAARWGWYDQAITTATAARVFNDYALLYPRPYDAPVKAAAKLSNLTPEIIYGVIRQESLYRNDAVSPANARGLMQLQIDTARRTARRFKQPVPTDATLTEPAVNIVLGASHLRELLDRFGGQLPLALAGYNAGPNAAQRWAPAAPTDADIWIENIPYNETRGYVQRILWHSVVFGWLRRNAAQNSRDWVTSVR
jgi:soluble lytic murein transglycosylase